MQNEKIVKRRMAFAAGMLALMFVAPMLLTSNAQASYGYERGYPNNDTSLGEIYIEYPDGVYFNQNGGSGVTKFPVEFSVRQTSFWKYWFPLSYVYEVPDWWQVDVYIDDTSGNWDDIFTMMRFYPQQATDLGTTLQWSFDASAGGKYGQIGVNVAATGDPSSYGYLYNPASWNPPGQFVHLGSLFVEYNQGAEWSGATTNGAFTIAVRDDWAKSYANGHYIHGKLVFTLVWEGGNDIIHNNEVKYVSNFIIGDDMPSSTDSFLVVAPGYCSGS